MVILTLYVLRQLICTLVQVSASCSVIIYYYELIVDYAMVNSHGNG